MGSTDRQSAKTSSSRQTNLLLLVLLPLAVITGLVANTIGTGWGVHPSVFHGVVALATLILAPWKQVIMRRGLRKRRTSSWLSVALLLMVLIALTTGIVHVVGYDGFVGPLTLMQAHVGAAFLTLPLAWLHYRSHPVRLRRSIDMDRRALLRAGTLTVGAGLVWLGLEGTLDALGLAGGNRRFTGSHERSSHDAAGLPVTSWFDDRVQDIAAADWVLDVDGVSYTLSDIAAMPQEQFDAVLDCTSAWYSTQTWGGVRLDHIVEPGSHRSLVIRSRTGYSRRFPAHDLDSLWLATHVGGRVLSSGHGFPARIIAPGRRGFWWVKWVVQIETTDVPWWLQLPLPAT
jgi:hypothetical protein